MRTGKWIWLCLSARVCQTISSIDFHPTYSSKERSSVLKHMDIKLESTDEKVPVLEVESETQGRCPGAHERLITFLRDSNPFLKNSL